MPETVKKRLTQEQIESVSSKIAHLKDKNLRQRAFVSLLATERVSAYLQEKGVESGLDNSLYSVLPIYEHFDLATITVKNNIIIDIRAVLGDSYPHMCIPSEHFSLDVKPDIYIGVKIDKNLENVEFTGFVKAEGLSCQKGNRQYFVIDAEEMTPVSKIDEAITSIGKTEAKHLAVDHQKVSNLLIPFIDGFIEDNDRHYVLGHLLNCEKCRKELIDLYNIDSSLKNVKGTKGSKDSLLLEEDYSLRLFNSDPLLEGKEAKIEFLDEDDEEEQFEKLQDESIEDEDIDLSDEEESEEEPDPSGLEEETAFVHEEEKEPVEPEEKIDIIDEDIQLLDEITDLNDEELEEGIVFMPEEENEPVEAEQEETIELGEEEQATKPEPPEQDSVESAEPVTTSEIKDDIQKEKPIIDEIDENPPTVKKKHYIDWADELVNNRDSIENSEKALLSEDYIPKQELNDFFDETDLEKDLIDGLDLSEKEAIAEHIGLDENHFDAKKESPEIKSEIPTTKQPEKQPEEHHTQEPPAGTQKSIEEVAEESPDKDEEIVQEDIKPEEVPKENLKQGKDEEVDNILGKLGEVETINEEDDIESLFSVFGDAKTPKAATRPVAENLTPEKKPAENIPVAAETQKTPESVIPTTKKDGEYGTILGSGKEEQAADEEIDILLYEEGRAKVEVINQEELMSIFNSDASDEQIESNQTKINKLEFGSLFKDRNFVAFTVAVSLSTMVLFLSLSQVNQQINVAGTDVIKKPEKEQERASSGEIPVSQKHSSVREPMLSYTREVVKTIKEEKVAEEPEDILQKALAQKGTSKQEATPEPKVVDIQNISWELSASVANNPKVKSYFVDAGYMLKSRLSEDLYIPGMQNNGAVIAIYAELDNTGNILVTEIINSSGYDEIDKRCIKTFRTVVNDASFPMVELSRSKIKLNLIISI